MIHRPEGVLAQFIDFMWIDRGYTPTWTRERLLPSRLCALIVNLRGEPFQLYQTSDAASPQAVSDIVISGMQSRPLVLDAASRAATIGAVFRPGWAWALFDRPIDEFTDQTIALGDLWPRTAPLIRERLAEAPTSADAFRVLEHLLKQQLDRPLRPHPAITLATEIFDASPASLSVEDVADRTGYSQRRFSELFREQVGLTPKQYARISRFQKVLDSISRRDNIDWIDITFTAGYYDQSHFIRDFRQLAGCTPTEYMQSKTQNVNHVAIT